MHTGHSRRGVDHLARQLYLNAARDADVGRRRRAQRALAHWHRPLSESERESAAHGLNAAAVEYGLRPRAEASDLDQRAEQMCNPPGGRGRR